MAWNYSRLHNSTLPSTVHQIGPIDRAGFVTTCKIGIFCYEVDSIAKSSFYTWGNESVVVNSISSSSSGISSPSILLLIGSVGTPPLDVFFIMESVVTSTSSDTISDIVVCAADLNGDNVISRASTTIQVKVDQDFILDANSKDAVRRLILIEEDTVGDVKEDGHWMWWTTRVTKGLCIQAFYVHHNEWHLSCSKS